jgi:formylglycine-generating enzyme required for sulfatase activity
MATEIFISYRRAESRAHAHLIFQALKQRFPRRVFMDVDGLKPGEKFGDKINAQLDGCRVLLALIGLQWAHIKDEQGNQRLHDEEDWIRLELRTALQRQIKVIPVLIEGAKMPRKADLPPELHPLLKFQALTLDLDRGFDQGMADLADSIKDSLPSAKLPALPDWLKWAAPAAAVVAGGVWWAGNQPPPKAELPSVPSASTSTTFPSQPAQVPAQPLVAAKAPVKVGQTIKDCDVCPELVVLPRGNFMMGSSLIEPERFPDEGLIHRVTIDYDLAVGKYEITQGQWKAVMGGNPSRFKDCGDHCPVENVSWDDAQQYLKKLNARSGQRYRLLSESEWEYAARAGTTTPFSTGPTITTDQANFDGRSTYNGSATGVYRSKTVAVGSFAPNVFGLYDMHGNVGEWVQDAYHENYTGAPADGSAWESGDTSRRVLRGGSWYDNPRLLRSASRDWGTPDYRVDVTGFRLARTL